MLSARSRWRVAIVLAGALLAILVGAIGVGPSAHAASPSPTLLARTIREPVGTKLRRDLLARSAQSWNGGPITTSTGDTVTVFVSDTYTPDQVTPQYWAEFLAHLTHGPELSTVKLYIAPYAEVSGMCGPQALGCYGDDEIVSIGEPYVDGTTPEEIVRHEYGHHIAFSRSNPPWVAVDWGPKFWASSENVCSKVTRHLAYPGDEGEHYQLNPGEAWAETYRLMDERKAGITTGSWEIVSPSFYPGDAQLQAAEKDVLSPWTTTQTHGYRKVFGPRTKKVWTIPVATPLDGTIGVAAVLPKGSQSQVVLTSANGRAVLARAVRSGARSRRISSTVCGQRSLAVRVTEKGPLGPVSVVTTTPVTENTTGWRSARRAVGGLTAVAGIVLVLAGGAAKATSSAADPLAVRDLDRGSLSRTSSSLATLARAARSSQAAATWCGTPTSTDLAPNATAGNAVHWIYAIPSDAADRFPTFADAMQTDAELIDSWWRGQDPTRTPRADLVQLPCGTQVDLSTVRLPLSGARLDNGGRFEQIFDEIVAAGFRSPFVKYIVYYDGPISEQGLCGQGGSLSTGLGAAVVYVRSCVGIPPSVVAAHELLHTLGAVPNGAPHDCPPPNDGHTCDTPTDIMYPFVSPAPLSSKILDPGHDDYYGHSGSWPDVQDSRWLVQLDRQVPFSLAISGPGSVASDAPGLLCSQSCSTTWNDGTQLNLTATPAAGTKLVRWTGACSGGASCSVTVQRGATVTALFAPATYRLNVSHAGRGTVQSARRGIACGTRCSAAVPSYTALRLRATPAKGWRFRGWSGACRGAKTVCTVPMTKNTSARAIFVRA